jgi:hypothetical protein
MKAKIKKTRHSSKPAVTMRQFVLMNPLAAARREVTTPVRRISTVRRAVVLESPKRNAVLACIGTGLVHPAGKPSDAILTTPPTYERTRCVTFSVGRIADSS